MDISSVLKNTKVSLEQEAFRQFGSAVEGQVKNLPFLGLNKRPEKQRNPDGTISADEAITEFSQPGLWDTARYSSNIASGAGGYDPKQKFLFKVTFHFNPLLLDSLSSMGLESEMFRDLTFMVQQIDLPKIQFEYGEANMYNFRTKYLKSIQHRDVSFSFLDDIGNKVINLVNAYRMLHQPIARQASPGWPSVNHSDYGFEFGSTPDSMNIPSASNRTALVGNARSILSKIVIHQFYVSRAPSGGSVANMVKTNDFIFMNPQIVDFDMGELNHENSGEPNLVTAAFAFDSLTVMPSQSTFENGKYKHAGYSIGGADILDTSRNENIPYKGNPPIVAGGGGNSPFANIVGGAIGGAVQGAVGGFLYKKLGSVAGGALSGAISQVTTAIGSQARNTIGGISQNVAGAVTSRVSDSLKSASSTRANRITSTVTDPPPGD